MANYYVAFDSNHVDGPYSFEELEALYKEGKILSETLVCPEGGQEWLSFGRIYHLTKNTNRKSEEKETEWQPKKRFVYILLDKSEKRREERLLKEKVPKGNLIESKKESILEKDPSWKESQEWDEQELNKQLETQKSDAELFLELFRTVEGIFRFVGIIALIAGFILFCNNVEEKQTEIGFIYLVSGAFSCLGCFWCAKVLTLLQKIADKK